MNLPLDRALAATGATLLDAQAAPQFLRVSTDTRSLEPGDAFLALRGETFDGHDFAGEAVRKGAAALIVEDAASRVGGTATLVVEHAGRAYLALAALARELFDGRVVGITGSAGKTTTKALLAQLLRAGFGDRVLAAPNNENNELGVSKLILSASNELHDVLIVEMGARHYGDVEILVTIARPQIGVLTNVGDAHVEIMGSRERLAETKWALFSQGARAVLGADDEISRARAATLATPPLWFTAIGGNASAPIGPELDPLVAVARDALWIRRDGRDTAYSADIRLPGLHNRRNLAAALAGALELGVAPRALAAQIPALELPPGRYARIAIAGGPQVIYDAYNANASGMIAALDAFADEEGARRIAVLASMAELGDESQELHERVGAHAAGRVDVLLVSGDFAAALERGARRAGLDRAQIVAVDDNADTAAWLRAHAHAGDVVLLKGSRKYKMEEIVEELLA